MILLPGPEPLLLLPIVLRKPAAKASCESSKLMPATPASRVLRMDCGGVRTLVEGAQGVLGLKGRLQDIWDFERIMLDAVQAKMRLPGVPGWTQLQLS